MQHKIKQNFKSESKTNGRLKIKQKENNKNNAK